MSQKDALGDEVKAFILEALARYDGPSIVAKAVNEEFGVEVSRQAVAKYDPTKVAGRELSKRWREHFDAARKAFKEDTDDIPVAHKAVRLRTLQRGIAAAEAVKNWGMVAQLLEQAAREMGGAFTNRRELSGPNGGAIPVETISARERIDARLAEIASRAAGAPADDGKAGRPR